ncbi:MAG: HmuY family protein, partial [Bacteroidota bacterium]
MIRSVIFTLLLTMAFSGCLEKETPIPPRPAGDVKSEALVMGTDYLQQLYFDLGTGQLVGQNTKLDWDLAFSTNDSLPRVYLNGARAMYAAATGTDDFSVSPAPADLDFRWDRPSGHVDSTAVGDWELAPGQVYVIDRGSTSSGGLLGYFKLKINGMADGKWDVQVGELGDASGTSIELPVDPNYNFSFFSFPNLNQPEIEPPAADWDLWFTQYTERLELNGEYIAYLVTGVLINSNGVRVAEDSTMAFEEIDRDFAEAQTYSEARHEIGFDWKVFDFDLGFIVNADRNYLIQDTEGVFYKLHFIDFYDAAGN